MEHAAFRSGFGRQILREWATQARIVALEAEATALRSVERRKTASAEGLADFAARWNMAPIPRADCLVLDTEAEAPDAVAKRIRHFALDQKSTGSRAVGPKHAV